ncbi:MAG: cobalamin-dependent protein, partial [Clostridia bacterium]|nr:cobalamin-dependent protein [Clostridia bacterium]
HISGGVSNLSFSFRGNNYVREALHAVFLYHAIAAGMDMGIVNPQTSVQYEDIPEEIRTVMEDVILNRTTDATERLIEIASTLKEKSTGAAQQTDEAWRNTGVEERLKTALLKGIGEHLEEDIAEAVEKYKTAVNVIGGPLMDGMGYVGELFGEGKLFLPQVVKTARTMKQAVAILQPLIEQQRSGSSASAGKILIATVKGDIHDIGKNIVKVILENYGYKIIDLGRDVDKETIAESLKANKATLLGLSALMTTTVKSMEETISYVRENCPEVRIMVGGAVLNKQYADKIGADYYAKDAKAASETAKNHFKE